MSGIWDFKLIDVTRWEFGMIHETKQTMELRGWELDAVVQFNGQLCGAEDCVSPIRLRFKRRRSA